MGNWVLEGITEAVGSRLQGHFIFLEKGERPLEPHPGNPGRQTCSDLLDVGYPVWRRTDRSRGTSGARWHCDKSVLSSSPGPA